MSAILATAAMNVFFRVIDHWKSGNKVTSLIAASTHARAEPLCLIDNDAAFAEALPETMRSLLTLYTAYYMQALAITSTVGRIDPGKQLERLNPARDASSHIESAKSWIMATESFKYKLPTPNEFKAALESATLDAVLKGNKPQVDDTKDGESSAALGKDSIANLRETVDLSIGKIFNVTISDNGNEAVIPVSVRLMANMITTTELLHILTIGAEDNSADERYHGWRSGRLSLIKDNFLNLDLIRAHRHKLMKDNSGFYESMVKRYRSNQASAFLSGKSSIAQASNIVVMTTETLEKLEGLLMGKFSNFAVRDRVFKNTQLMLIAVIDKSWDRVTFYHDGIAHSTTVTKAAMSSGNAKGPDVSEILKAYQLGNSPSM